MYFFVFWPLLLSIIILIVTHVMHISIVHSFLLLNSILCMDVLSLFIHSPLDGHLDCFRFGAITNRSLKRFRSKSLLQCVLSLLLG